MIILGIDPGASKSGYVLWDTEDKVVFEHMANIVENNQILKVISYLTVDLVAIERIRGYGIVAGDDTFDTCEWVGVFANEAKHAGKPVVKIPRKDVKRHLCGNTTTNDKYVRQALIDRYGEQGTKKKPGPLFGIANHIWAALAVAVVAGDMVAEGYKDLN